MNIESLREQFDDLGVDATEQVLERCLEICKTHDLDDPAEFVEKWMAYSISNLNGAEPTIEYLNEMENRQYKNVQRKVLKRSSQKESRLKIYNQGNDEDMNEEENELLGSYVTLTPKNDKKSASRLHIGTPDMKSTNTFSPVSYSPLTTTKRSRIESGKTGNVVCTFGNFSSTASNIVKNSETIATISVANLFGTQWMDDKVKFMTTSMNDGQYVTERIFKLGHEFLRKIVVDEKLNDQIVLSHCDELSQDNVKCLGKIVCGGRSEKLDQKSCTFIGFDENKLRITQLDMTRMKMPAQIFPGQVCVLNGTNPRGKNFSISEIHAERILENCTYPSRLTEPLSFVIGSGPFTSDDNLTFEYLDKLIENCQNNKPDVLILSGAFFDAKSKLIFDLATEVDEHFRKMLTNMSEKLGDSTKIVIVASHDDINSSACFPTRSYGFSGKKGFSNNIFLAPDPCILNVNGIKIAVTSVDVTKHLADSEFCM
ncbi:hypothetical protein ACKWTF_016953 [Chironomus riparius]